MQELLLFGLGEQGDVEKQATQMPPNREESQGRVVVQAEFARINYLPLKRGAIVQPGGIPAPKKKGDNGAHHFASKTQSRTPPRTQGR